ncbi:hypothetical protein VNO77_21256 [Canavalia gladiata]|uniref:Hepcidin n=1 Tax=Canavalia gladiata TaxID=3824 RepID=A0AAN9QK44_CANGL
MAVPSIKTIVFYLLLIVVATSHVAKATSRLSLDANINKPLSANATVNGAVECDESCVCCRCTVTGAGKRCTLCCTA